MSLSDPPRSPKPKNHVRYETDLRLRAKKERLGTYTVHVRFPDGSEREYQGVATPEECRFAAWAGALLCAPRIRRLPDLEQVVREDLKPATESTIP